MSALARAGILNNRWVPISVQGKPQEQRRELGREVRLRQTLLILLSSGYSDLLELVDHPSNEERNQDTTSAMVTKPSIVIAELLGVFMERTALSVVVDDLTVQ